jgi:peptidyl-dipeptidase Dcp
MSLPDETSQFRERQAGMMQPYIAIAPTHRLIHRYLPDNHLMSNPFFEPLPETGIPNFQKIQTEHYSEAFERAFANQREEVEVIVANPDAPNFANSVEALEHSGELLRRVGKVFWNLRSSDATPEIQALEREMAPRLSAHQSAILSNPLLFARIAAVRDETPELDAQQRQLLETTYSNFVRAGAALDTGNRARVSEISEELASLFTGFTQNVLHDSNSYELVLSADEDLAGLPKFVREMARQEAISRGKPEHWVFTTARSSITPFLQYADNRDLRRAIYQAYTGCGTREVDNRPLIRQIIALRQERARLLGFGCHADYMLDDRMAKTTGAVRTLLDQIWGPCRAQVAQESEALLARARRDDPTFELQPWDWWYYTEKLRRESFDLDPDEVKQYFELGRVLEGAFAVARQLYGIVFRERPELPVYHPEVKVYEVSEADGSLIGYFLFDFFMRPSKRSGAWMSAFRSQSNYGQRIAPVIVNCCNFPKSSPCLLGMDEVRTLFHEFGHGLHGLLSNVRYESLSGTSVKQDFVELPSQIMEHWAVEPEVLKSYARHVHTNEPMPDALMTRLRDSRMFNQGFATTEYLAACYLDLAWHSAAGSDVEDIERFEAQAMEAIGKTPMIDPRYKSTYFQHIFSGDYYSAGYYVYIWAEVLDADGFEAFRENGLFDPGTAAAFRQHVLEMGGSENPMTLYRRFRGREPRVEPLLRNRGLA